MRRLSFFLLGLLTISSLCLLNQGIAVAQGRFVPIGVNASNGSATMLDSSSVKTLAKGHVQFNSVTKPLKPMKTKSGESIEYKVAVYDGDCSGGSVKLLKGEYHDGNGVALFSKMYPDMTFRPMATGSVGRDVLNAACTLAGVK